MKITIIGAGSPYTPELVGKFAEEQNDLPVREICLTDIDARKLGIMHGFCGRFAKRLGLRAEITATADISQALDGADFVNTQIRVGGNMNSALSVLTNTKAVNGLINITAAVRSTTGRNVKLSYSTDANLGIITLFIAA